MPNIENQPYVVTNTAPVNSTAFSWWGLLAVMVILLGMFAVCWIIVRTMKNSQYGTRGNSWIRILDRQPLGGQTSLYLVEIAGKLQILGASDHNLVRIIEIDDPNVATDILEEIALRPVEAPQGVINFFKEILNTFKRRKNFNEELELLLEEDEKL